MIVADRPVPTASIGETFYLGSSVEHQSADMPFSSYLRICRDTNRITRRWDRVDAMMEGSLLIVATVPAIGTMLLLGSVLFLYML